MDRSPLLSVASPGARARSPLGMEVESSRSPWRRGVELNSEDEGEEDDEGDEEDEGLEVSSTRLLASFLCLGRSADSFSNSLSSAGFHRQETQHALPSGLGASRDP